MTFKQTFPAPETYTATHSSGTKLYTYLSPCPLYVTVRVIGPALPASRRRSFWIGWDIEQARWTGTADGRALPAEFLAWAAPLVQADYPALADVGLSQEDIAHEKAALAFKRQAKKAAKGNA